MGGVGKFHQEHPLLTKGHISKAHLTAYVKPTWPANVWQTTTAVFLIQLVNGSHLTRPTGEYL